MSINLGSAIGFFNISLMSEVNGRWEGEIVIYAKVGAIKEITACCFSPSSVVISSSSEWAKSSINDKTVAKLCNPSIFVKGRQLRRSPEIGFAVNPIICNDAEGKITFFLSDLWSTKCSYFAERVK